MLVSLVSGILDPFWALPFVAIAITYFNALICIYWLVYNKIRDRDRADKRLERKGNIQSSKVIQGLPYNNIDINRQENIGLLESLISFPWTTEFQVERRNSCSF